MMKIDGGCYCGEITYEADVDPEKVAICNCMDCQRMSGSAVRSNVYVDENDLKFLTGKATEFIKTSESGHKRAIGFCGNCGTALYACNADGEPRTYGLRALTSNQRDQLVPKGQYWLRSRPAWFADLDSIPGHQTQ